VLKNVPWLQHSLPSSKLPLETSSQELFFGNFRKCVSMAEQLHTSLRTPCTIPLECCKACRHWTLEQWKRVHCFSMTTLLCTKRGPYRNGLRSVWKNFTGLDRALNSIPSNTFGMNWNGDCEPGLIAQHQCLTSLMLLWLNGSKSPQQCSNIGTFQMSGGCYFPKGGGEQLHSNSHDFGMRCLTSRCPHTFGMLT
jgi:hypothetical protein